MNYVEVFSKIYYQLEVSTDPGKVASYIPELRDVNPDKFGIHLTTIDDEHFDFGDSDERFSIQSIAKVLALVLAYKLEDEKLWDRVGVEPSGTLLIRLFSWNMTWAYREIR